MDDQKSYQSVECQECHAIVDGNSSSYVEEIDGYICDDCMDRIENDIDDSVDETNYDPYSGCDVYEYDYIDDIY